MSYLKHIKSIDGLRAIAILLVLFYHCTPDRNPHLGIESIPLKIAALGWSGVDLFFVLSGFLITRILLTYKEKNTPYKSFFTNRLLRIVPAYYCALIIIFIVIPLVSTREITDALLIARHFLYISNFYYVGDIYDGRIIIGHFWTLAVEMQFYLVFPFLIFFLKKYVHQTILGIWIAFLICRSITFATSDNTILLSIMTTFRIDGLLLGAFIAAFPHSLLKYKVSFLIVLSCSIAYLSYIGWYVLSSIAFKIGHVFSIHQIFIPIAINILYAQILIFSLSSKFFSPILESQILSSIAKYSYGIYIYHYIIYPAMLDKIYPFVVEICGRSNTSAILFFLIMCIISMLVAYISFHLIEKHFLQLKK